MLETVRVDGGLLAGVREPGGRTTAYRGIPYAAPPVGALRWRPPQPAAAWAGVRRADSFAPQCVQPGRAPDSVYAEYSGTQAMSEDCLYLNVFTPARGAGERLPVMVWFHGGAFLQGSGSNPVFVRGDLAEQGVVLVTFNYRLGPFGFLAHPALSAESAQGSSGNYGLMDMAVALQWVRRNIAAFGGDTENVTLFGQSAGAAGVIDMMASPRTAGLFAKAMVHSFGTTGMATLAQAEQAGAAFARQLRADLPDLRSRGAQELLQASLGRGLRFSPIVDGWFMPEPVRDIFAAGRQRRVPLVAGWNADEGSAFGFAPDAAGLRQRLATQFPGHSAQAEHFYPATDDGAARASGRALFGDTLFAQGTHAAARSQAAAGVPTYLYHFVRAQPFAEGHACREISPARDLGAFHSAEYPYVFGTLDVLTRPWTAEDRQLSRLMQGYWTRFARTGDPNGDGAPAWPRFEPGRPTVLELGAQPRRIAVPRQEHLAFIERCGPDLPDTVEERPTFRPLR